MDEAWVIEVAREAIKTAMLIGGPLLLAALFVGLLVSVFQALTQINEATLTFIPKMLAIGGCILVFGPFMLRTLVTYTQHIFENMNLHVR